MFKRTSGIMVDSLLDVREVRRVHRRHSGFGRTTILVENAQGQYAEPGSPLLGLDLGVDYLLAA